MVVDHMRWAGAQYPPYPTTRPNRIFEFGEASLPENHKYSFS